MGVEVLSRWQLNRATLARQMLLERVRMTPDVRFPDGPIELADHRLGPSIGDGLQVVIDNRRDQEGEAPVEADLLVRPLGRPGLPALRDPGMGYTVKVDRH
ncbi:MAG: hypothetical protein H0W81_09590 [Chloroflexi bacterium]|nr:hypothetical protein [Chloroflexota bacterium]